MKRAFIVLLLAAICITVGCTKAGLKEEVIFEQGMDSVVLVHETDKEGNVVSKGFDHPVELTSTQVDMLLGELHFSKYSFFKWRGNKSVFIDKERNKLAKHFSGALKSTTPDSWISFQVTAKKRDLLLPTRRITDGYVWVQDGKMNFVLGNLNFELSDVDEPYKGDPRDRYSIGALQLNELDGLTHPPVDKSDRHLRRPHNNWLIIDYKSILGIKDGKSPERTIVKPVSEPLPKKEEAPAPAPAPDGKAAEQSDETIDDTKAPAPEVSLEERFEKLKELFEKGFITEEEFNKKKEELLKQL